MRRKTTEQQEGRARRVQPSGRPCGDPSRLDAGRHVCERQPQAKRTAIEQPFQTPDHNLIPTKTGPTIGVHFNLPGGGVRLRLLLNNLAEVERWILSWGSHATVVRPDRLRDNLLKIAGELQARYSEPRIQITKPKKLPGL